MKTVKIILVLLVAGFILNPLLGQNREGPEPPAYSLFAAMNVVSSVGGWMQPLNTNTRGFWGSMYLGARLDEYKTEEVWSVGAYLVANRSGFTANLSRYTAWTTEFGGGAELGYYGNIFQTPAFIGLSAGVKHSLDMGESNSRYGKYKGEQRDWLLTLALNFNIIKVQSLDDNNMWPRTQLMIHYEKPLHTESGSEWNGSSAIGSNAWDRTYIQVTAKQSIMNYYLSVKHVFTPKFMLYYSRTSGDSQDSYGVGAEVSMHKPYKDDMLSIFYLYKINDGSSPNVSVMGLSVNLALLF